MRLRTIGLDQAIKNIKDLSAAEVRANRRAIDQTATAGRKKVIEIATRETGLKSSIAGKGVKVTQRTKKDTLTAEITISAKRIAVKEFSPKISTKGAITADIFGTPGRGPQVLRYAFHPVGKGTGKRKTRKTLLSGKKMNWGKSAIFERVPEGAKRAPRYPIRLALGPSMAGILTPGLDDLEDEIMEVLSERTFTELMKEINK